MQLPIEPAIRSLCDGRRPVTLLDWLTVAGRVGLSVRIAPLPDRCRGALCRDTVMVPAGADEPSAVRVIAHEVAERLAHQAAHEVARAAEAALTRPDTVRVRDDDCDPDPDLLPPYAAPSPRRLRHPIPAPTRVA